MTLIVISLLIISISVLVLSEICLISMVSVLFLAFILNVFIVSNVSSKCKQTNEKVDELQTNQVNNHYNCNFYSMIYYIKRPFIHLTQLCFHYISTKLSKHLTDVEKTLSEKPFCGHKLNIKMEFEEVSHLITENYVDFWYQSIGTDNKDFENDCQMILQKMFINLFKKCQQIDKQMFFQKFIILLENHLNVTKSFGKLSLLQISEDQRLDSIIERVVRLTATEDITCVISNQNRGLKSSQLSLVLMIKAMLSHSVFIPIIDIITEQKFVYENLFYLVTDSELKLNDSKEIEYQLKNVNQINEPFIEFKNQIKRFDSANSIGNTNKEFDNKLMKQFSKSSEEEEDSLRANDLRENESNDELIFEAIEAEEETDEKLISNLVITKAEEITESYNSSFILYFIEYDGFVRHTKDPQISANFSDQKIFLLRKRVSVQRRFSEFVSLQKILERNKSFKRLMKGIKKPSAIQITAQNLLALTGSVTRLDSSTVEFRRIYLQNFLIQLSNLKAITESPEFNQFLAFGSDGRIAFVSSNSDNNMALNIDKFFVRGVKGAISLMKSAFPIEAQIGKIDPKFSERTMADNEKLTIRLIETGFKSDNFMQLEKKLNIWSEINSDDSSTDTFDLKENISTDKLIRNNDYLKSSYLGARTLGDGCEDPNSYELNLDNKNTFQLNSSHSFHTINCLLLLISNNMDLIEKIIYIKIMAFILGTTIQRFISELVSKMLTNDMFVRHIHSLHSALWPTDKSEVQNESEVQNIDCLTQTVDAFYDYIKSRLCQINPHFNYIVEKPILRRILTNSLIKFENCNKNKLLLYELIELILHEIQ